jgi:hypothetical protein
LQITVCPPAPAHYVLPTETVFANQKNHAVHAEAAHDEEGFSVFTTSGISFDDFSRMQTHRRLLRGGRRLATPDWAIDPKKLRAAITRYFEIRAFGGARVARQQMPGTQQERLARAQAKLLADKPKKLAILDGLCAQYVQLKQQPDAHPDRVRKLEQLIEGLDTALRLIDMGPGVFVAIVYLYYRVGLDSVGVASELGLKSPNVRQTLFRMSNLWAEMSGLPKPGKKTRQETWEGKEARRLQRERERADLAALRAERRERNERKQKAAAERRSCRVTVSKQHEKNKRRVERFERGLCVDCGINPCAKSRNGERLLQRCVGCLERMKGYARRVTAA